MKQLLVCSVLAAQLLTSTGHAAGVSSYILATDDRDQDGAPGRIIKIDPTSGEQSLFAEGGLLRDPYGIAVENASSVVVADYTAQAIIRLNLNNAAQTTVSSGFANPLVITVAPNGSLLVGDFGARAVIRVDPVTGAQSTVSSGGHIGGLRGIVVELAGTILVTDDQNHQVIRIDPTIANDGTGNNQTVLSSDFVAPKGLSVGSDAIIYVADPGDFAIDRLDPSTGVKQLLTQSGNGLG